MTHNFSCYVRTDNTSSCDADNCQSASEQYWERAVLGLHKAPKERSLATVCGWQSFSSQVVTYFELTDYVKYRVTITLVQNLPLTSQQKFCFGLTCPALARPKRNFCFEVNRRF